MVWGVVCLAICAETTGQTRGFESTIQQVQPKMVKIVGSGGFQGLEPYQSGFLVSADGLVLTVWSYVLDSDVVTVTLDDGQRFEAKLVGYDPRVEIAILKIPATGLSHFNLDQSVTAEIGSRILAFSNLYGVATGNESTSVLHGIVSAKTQLAARRGAVDSTYQGQVYLLDAVTNNAGAAGGAVTDRRGRLIGMIGKELRDRETNTWLNFVLPIRQLTDSVSDIQSGKMVVQSNSKRRQPSEPMTAQLAGFVLVPNVVSRTPPYVDRVLADSAAAAAGLKPDDLVIDINGRMTPSNQDVLQQLSLIDRDSNFQMTVQRGKRFEVLEIQMQK